MIYKMILILASATFFSTVTTQAAQCTVQIEVGGFYPLVSEIFTESGFKVVVGKSDYNFFVNRLRRCSGSRNSLCISDGWTKPKANRTRSASISN